MSDGTETLLALLVVTVLAVIILVRFFPIALWIMARSSGVRVSFLTLFGMRFRGVNPVRIVHPLINAQKSGLDLNAIDLEAHHLAGGNVDEVVRSLISAKAAGQPISFGHAAATDLVARDGANRTNS